ncbi:MAG: SCP2 sterol-binding domain-containing protein [Pseudomonadales bacterium]
MQENDLIKLQESLAPHFKPGFLQRHHTVFQFHFESDSPFHLTVTADTFEFSTGIIDEPTVTILVDNHETLWALMDGRYDGMRAFMEGKYRADGNIVLSQLLLYLFKSNDPTNIYQVQD